MIEGCCSANEIREGRPDQAHPMQGRHHDALAGKLNEEMGFCKGYRDSDITLTTTVEEVE